VVLVQLAIPSRQDVEEYQNLRACVNELVGKINGRFGTVDHTPIHYLHRSVPFEELNSMFAMSDACLITSTRDGMNLVCLLVPTGRVLMSGRIRVHLDARAETWFFDLI
jgi:trehalose 6-phosphate synthase